MIRVYLTHPIVSFSEQLHNIATIESTFSDQPPARSKLNDNAPA